MELLGYSQLELVQELLMNRAVIVDKILKESNASDNLLIASGKDTAASTLLKSKYFSLSANFHCQIPSEINLHISTNYIQVYVYITYLA